MKNLGITNYASLVSMQLNKEMEIHVNPVEETSNVHYVLPLYQSRYKMPLNLQLIYNHQNLSTDLGLGKGIRSNYHMSLDYNDNEAYLTFADGATLTYLLDFVGNSGKTRVYKNSETNTTISVAYGTYDPQFFLYYNDGTVIDFTPAANKLMVKLIRKKNGERYSFEYDSSGRMIEVTNNALKVEKITFVYTTNDYVLIQAWKTSKTGIFEEVKAMKVYKNTAANFLNFLWEVQVLDKVSSTTLLKDYYFGYSLPNYCLNIAISEQLSNLSCSIKFDESLKVKSITDELGRQTTFSKINKYTTKLIDYRNKETEIVVDSEGRIQFIKDNFRNRVSSLMFNENNKLVSSSKVLSFNSHLNGKLQVMNSSAPNDLMSASLTDMPSFLSDFYQVSKCYRVSTTSGSGAKYVQIYNIEGNKFDVYSLGVWAKINAFGSLLSYATINVFFVNDLSNYASGKQFSKEIKIKPKDVDSQQFEFYMTSAYAKQSYKYVVIELCYHGDTMSMDVIFDLYKRGLTSLYEYDENGNQITCLEGRNISELVFNGDNSVAATQFVNYEYDENGNVIKSIDAFGKIEKMTYDNSNNVLTHSISDGTKELFSSSQYLDEESVVLSKDNNEIELESEESSIYIKTKGKQKYDTNNKLFENYEYSTSNKEQVMKKSYKDNDIEELGKINYAYLSNGKISSFSNNGVNSRIQFSYDAYGRHYGYRINNSMFRYNTYSLINGVPALISASGFGMKDAYNYEYDNYDRLIKVIYSLDSSTLFEYTYDDNDNIKTIKDCTTNITYEFEYDEENNLVNYSYDDFVVNNIMDESNSSCAKKVNVENDKIITTSHSIFKSLNNDFDTYKMTIRNNTDIMLCMFDEFAVTYKDESNGEEYVKYEQKIKLLNTKNKNVISYDSTTKESNCTKDGFMTLYNLDSSNSFMFNVSNKVNPKNSVAFSFKPTSSGTLMTMGDGSTVSLSVGLSTSNKIVVIDNGQTIYTSPNIFPLNTWHFMCLTYDLSSNSLQIHIDDDKYSITFNNAHSSLYLFTFGSSITGQITNIMIPQKGIINDEDYDSYFKSFKYLLALNESRKDLEGNVIHKSSKEFIRNFPYDFIPLNNGTAGFNNNETILPISDSVLELPCLSSKNAEFVYNDLIEKSAYFAMGQHLVYDLNQSTSGTLSIHANRLFKDEENILFDLVDANNNHITLSIMSDKLKLLFGDSFTISSVQTLLGFTNKWNVITLSWNKNSINGYDVVVWLNNNKVINKTLYPSTTFSSFDVHIGRNSITTDKYGKCFNGLLEMLVFTNTFISDSVQSIVSSVNKQNKITHEYDALNLLNKSKVFDNNNEILTNSYDYKELTSDPSSELNRISTLLKKETINNDVYQYEYDVRGNVKTIKKNGVTLHQYSYDELGRLLTSNNEKYIYDSNGNITSVTDLQGNVLHTYSYDSNYSDLLTSFDNQQITYDSGNTYNPVSIGQYKTLTYQCNKLATFRDINKGFYNLYYYDDLGNRIKKVRYNNSGLLMETIKYYYDENGELIYQKVDSTISTITHNKTLTFMYDELNQLYGFIYNGNRYYYVKDSLNNILGIVDSTGNYIVKYNYDAWGNIISVEDNSTDLIGSINPFKYKCYYYDSDIEMYYCKARYYVPLWKRWLTPDNPKYLDFGKITALNLFSYCNNSPLLFKDNNGNFAITASCLLYCLIGLFAVASVATVAKVEQETHFIEKTTNAIVEGVITLGEELVELKTNIKSKIDGIELAITAYIATLIYNNKNKYHYHHIVAQKDWRALPSRIILEKCGIGINSKDNLVRVDSGMHMVMHTDVYYIILNMSISAGYGIAGEEGVKAVLNIYRNILGGE